MDDFGFGLPGPDEESQTQRIVRLRRQVENYEERLRVLERLAAYAVTCESRNTDEWMKGLQSRLDDVLKSQDDSRRVTYDGRELRLRESGQ